MRMVSSTVRHGGGAGWLGRERARPERLRAWPHAWKLAVATVCFGAFMGQLDASIVTLTYRPVQAEFGAGLAGVEWVSLAYLLVLISLVVPVGRLSDAHGRKLLYLYGFVVFTAGSAACGFAPSLGLLIAFRAVQALGAAMLQANSVALVTTSAPPARCRAALGVQAGAQALGLAVGPSMGGILVSTVGWRWVYLINVPVGVIAVVSGYFLLPRTRDRSPATGLDWWGVGLLAVAASALLLAISTASGMALPAEITLGLLAVSAWAAWAFVTRQRRVTHPLIDMALLQNRVVSWGLLGAMCGYLVLFGPLLLVPVVLADQGRSAVAAGLALTALPAGFALAALVADRVLPGALSERQRATLGAAFCSAALGVGLFVALTPTSLVPLLVAHRLRAGGLHPVQQHPDHGVHPRAGRRHRGWPAQHEPRAGHRPGCGPGHSGPACRLRSRRNVCGRPPGCPGPPGGRSAGHRLQSNRTSSRFAPTAATVHSRDTESHIRQGDVPERRAERWLPNARSAARSGATVASRFDCPKGAPVSTASSRAHAVRDQPSES